MSQKRDYYEVLNVPRDADETALKKAYRKLAVKYHPDRNPDDPSAAERFREATEAYEVLKDPQKRALYDRYGHAGAQAGPGAGGFGGGYSMDINEALSSFLREFGGFGGLGDIFGDLLGGRGGAAQRQGRSLQIRLPLTLEEAAQGVTKKIKYKRLTVCAECGGTGAAKGSRAVACPQCQGRGRLRQVRSTLLGTFATEEPCGRCEGRGQVVERPCGACRGSGTVRGEKQREIQVPPGVDNGHVLDLRGEGDAGERGGPAGDLRVAFEVAEHEVFERHGDDLLLDLPVSPLDLALGARLRVPGLDGQVDLNLPAGTQSHEVFRLRGLGMPRLGRHGRGDLLVRVLAWTPQKLTAEQTAQLERLRAGLAGQVPAPRRRRRG